MPRTQEPLRRRKGGSGTSGWTDPGGVYHRRGRDSRPYWPELPTKEDGADHRQEEAEESRASAADISADPKHPTTTTKNTTPMAQTGADESKIPAVRPSSMSKASHKVKAKSKKKSHCGHSASTFANDEDFAFTTTAASSISKVCPRKAERSKSIHLRSSLIPNVSDNNGSVDTPHLVTPAAPSAGVTQPQIAIANATHTTEMYTNHHHSVQLKDNQPPWESPHPHSQSSQTSSKNTETPTSDDHERELETQRERHRLAMQEQNQKYGQSVNEKDNFIKKIQQEHELQLKEKDVQHAKALAEAVQQERTRITFQWEQDRWNHQQQLNALQQELTNVMNQLEQSEQEKLNEASDASHRMQRMAQSLIELSKRNRDAQEESQRQKVQLESAQSALEASKREMQVILASQKTRQLTLDDRQRELDRREQTLAKREGEIVASTSTGSSSSRLALMTSVAISRTSLQRQQTRETPSTVAQQRGQTQSPLEHDHQPTLQNQQNQLDIAPEPQKARLPIWQSIIAQVQLQESKDSVDTNVAATSSPVDPIASSTADSSLHSPKSRKSTPSCEGGTAVEPLRVKTLPRIRSPSRKRLRDVIPSYDFMGIEIVCEPKKGTKHKKAKLTPGKKP